MTDQTDAVFNAIVAREFRDGPVLVIARLRDDDDASAARGLVTSLILGAALWAALWAVFRW